MTEKENKLKQRFHNRIERGLLLIHFDKLILIYGFIISGIVLVSFQESFILFVGIALAVDILALIPFLIRFKEFMDSETMLDSTNKMNSKKLRRTYSRYRRLDYVASSIVGRSIPFFVIQGLFHPF